MQKLQLWLLRLAEPGRKPAREYRPSFERLWWEAGPAVLSALDNTGDRIPQNIGMRLRNWTEQAISSDPVAALELGALDQAFRDLSTFRLACYSYKLAPNPAPDLSYTARVVMTDRGYAFAVGKAQECVAQLAVALHGPAGALTILCAVGRDRQVLRQIVEMMEGLR